ncbi:hypothetical protein [Kitasatospora sp. NPDC090308]|uniref:hypothetical protein n=1 Tax=Kitasatospora sp. NPDC090308 TaxID=3364082 RepID=UPI00381621B2
MPRNRPGALRATAPRATAPRATAPRATAPSRRPEAPPPHVPGLSAAADRDVRRVEWQRPDRWVEPGATGEALRRYRAFLRAPGGRWRYPRAAEFSCCPGCARDDARHCRDVLAALLPHLPPRSRAELVRLLRPLDAEFRRRTLPDPFAPPDAPWWWRRLGDSPWG